MKFFRIIGFLLVFLGFSLRPALAAPLFYTTLDNTVAVSTPTNGTGVGSTVVTTPVNDFVASHTGNGIRVDAVNEYIRFQETDGATQNVELDKGTVDFWYQPFYANTDGVSHRIFNIGPKDQAGSIALYKRIGAYGNDLYLQIRDAAGNFRVTTVTASNYSWTANSWVNIRITWDSTVTAGAQNTRVYINGTERSYNVINTGSFIMPAESSANYIYIGSTNPVETYTATGVLDDFAIYFGAIAPSPSCVPNCSGKVCGTDGCGGTCGSCGVGFSCNSSGNACLDTQAPTASSGLTATAFSTSQINLNWNAATDNLAVSGYDVYRGAVKVGSTTTATTYSDTGLTPGTNYSYTVYAKDAAGNISLASNTASTTTQAAPPPVPNVLINPGLENGGSGWLKTTNGGRSITTLQANSGSASAQMIVSNLYGRDIYQDVGVTANQNYYVEGWIKTSGVGGNGATIKIEWINAVNVQDLVPAGNLLRTDVLNYITGTQNWLKLANTFVAPAGAVVARFRFFTDKDPDNSGTAWFDDTVLSVAGGLDTTPPSVSVTYPLAGSTVSNFITVKANATDNVGVAGVQFKIDGVNLGAEVTTSPYSVLWDTTTKADGPHVITALARDSANNSTVSAAVTVTVNNTNRPNIVFILTDDQRFDSMPYMPITTSLLGPSSVKFSNFFDSTPLCCPSRASILTGKFAHNTGIHFISPQGGLPNGGATSFNDSSTVAIWLKDSGYKTGLYGKYLNGYFNLAPYVPPGWSEWHALVRDNASPQTGYPYGPYYQYELAENGSVSPTYGTAPADYLTDVLATKSAQFITSTPANQPFFLYLAPLAPHDPYVPAPIDIDKFASFPNWRPVSYNEADVSDKPTWVQNLPPISTSSAAIGDSNHQKQLESLQAVDRLVENIYNTLQATGRLNNTYIVFSSDNGLSWGEHRVLDDKICVYEECVKVPMWVKGPGIVGRDEASLVENIDFAPTFAQWAGVVVPNNVNGQSISNLLVNPQVPWRTEVLLEGWGQLLATQSTYGFSAVRTTRYVYSEYLNGTDRELYDLVVDPYQLDNKINDPSYLPIVTQLQPILTSLKNQ